MIPIHVLQIYFSYFIFLNNFDFLSPIIAVDKKAWCGHVTYPSYPINLGN